MRPPAPRLNAMAVDELTHYEYEPLNTSKQEFRLLELKQGSLGDGIICQIHHRVQAPVSEPESYEALSYTWGGEPAFIRIVRSNGTATRFAIQANLHFALRRLRLNDKSRWLWVDAICIDQAHDIEKDHQVANMAKIYTNAWRVCIWLGLDEDKSHLAFQHMKRILDFEEVDQLVTSDDPAIIEAWAAFFTLLRRRWFSRRWVVQEVALAKRAAIFCGEQDEVPWPDFADAVQLFNSSSKALNLLFRRSNTYHHTHNYLGNVAQLSAVCLVRIANSVLRSFDDNNTPHRHLNLEALVSTLTAFDSQNSRDTIYSVLALSKDAQPKNAKDETTVVATVSANRQKRATSHADEGDSHLDPGHKRQRLDSVSASASVDGSRWRADSVCKTSDVDLHGKGEGFEGGLIDRASITPYSSPPTTSPSSPQVQPLLKPPLPRLEIPTPEPSLHSAVPSAATSATVQRFINTLVSTTEWRKIEVNYRKPVNEIFKDFVALALKSSRDRQADSPLDVILRPWAPKIKKQDGGPLPSWMREVTEAPFGKQAHRSSYIYIRVNADALVGSPDAIKKPYNASRATECNPLISKTSSPMTLTVDGFIFDEIDSTSNPSVGGNVPQEWMEFAGWEDMDRAPPNELWRTLVADRDVTGEPVQSLYERAFTYITGKKVSHADLIPREILQGMPPKAAVQFVERMEAVIWRRRLIRSQRFERLGLAHRSAEPGDKICILYGCSVPVVLRPGRRGDRQYYTVVGDCYVHGIMDGEAFELPANDPEHDHRLLKQQKRTFVLH